MNATPVYDVTLYGLTRDEARRVEEAIITGGHIRAGIELHVDVHAPEPSTKPTVTHGSIVAATMTSADLGQGLVTAPRGSTPGVSPEAEASKAPEPAGWYPPERTARHLGRTVTLLTRNSLIAVYGGTRRDTIAAYDDLVSHIDTDAIAVRTMSNGHERVRLVNGTTIVPMYDEAPRGVSAHLVVLAVRPEAFTQRMAEHVAAMTAATAGTTIAMTEGSADA